MRLDLWSLCEGERHLRRLTCEPWRVVEGQHVVATRKLVDDNAQQAVLEALLEGAKPPLPPTRPALHYLLSTPFRYPPLRHGSRFGTVHQRGLWYGSLTRDTALAERAYYRLLFLAGTTADLGTLFTQETVFRAKVDAPHGLDLTTPPFSQHEARLSCPTDYADSQRFGTAAREGGVQAMTFPSARDPGRGQNVVLFEPVFASPRVFGPETWLCSAQANGVEFQSRVLGRSVSFPRAAFEIHGVLPAPGLG